MHLRLTSSISPDGDEKAQQAKKRTLYSRLSEKYFLPPIRSAGVTKKYLEKVEAGSVARFEIVKVKRFLADLKPSQLKKALYTNKYIVNKKVNKLLQEMGQPGLGFSGVLVPDGKWLYTVARYVDPWNITSVFEVTLQDMPDTKTDSFHVEIAKRRAADNLIFTSGLNKIKAVKQSLASLELANCRLSSREAEIESLVEYGRRLELQMKEDKKNLEQQLGSSALLVYCEGEKKTIEEALKENDLMQKQVFEL